ncbi:DUF551 domain-containing protein [Enterobacter kobei]|uniref:DUF551 domain-containing protein n=1 Tax=Enterobacter TaxID=547 RepID=UPI00216B14C8|nr:DUF551 domain-containing protein [Enterobacter sp. AM17-18]
MSNIDKHAVQAVADLKAGYTLGHADVAILKELARIALASLEVEAVAYADPQSFDNFKSMGGKNAACTKEWMWRDSGDGLIPVYTAPPAPVSVPDLLEQFAEFMAAESIKSGDYPDGWQSKASNAAHEYAQNIRAAMLQGADGTLTNEGTIPVTQFKPVADLYGLTSPTGGETSFTFDAVEARDFIDGGWSCQEYVELGRFQEAMFQNGNSPAQSDCFPEQNYIAPAQDGDSPALPDGWVACSERMPEDEQEVIVQNKMGYRYVSYFDEHSGLFFDMRGGNQMNCIEHIFVTHWMPLPAAPQQK